MYWVSGSRSSAVGTNGASAIASREVIRELARADGRLRGLVRLCEFLLNVVSPHVGERYNHGFVKAEGRQPWIDVIVLLVCIYQRAQVDDLVFSEPFPSWLCLADLQYVDGLGDLAGAPGAAAELSEDPPVLELGVRAFSG